MKLKDLTGKHILSGIEVGQKTVERYLSKKTCNYIKFTVDGTTYMALEDPSDGYRSYMHELVIVEEPCKIQLPNIFVCCHMRGNGDHESNDIIVFVDFENGKEILEIGTGNYDGYYPYCVLNYYPEDMSCNGGVVYE